MTIPINEKIFNLGRVSASNSLPKRPAGLFGPEEMLYVEIYRRISARIASPVLDQIKTGEEEGPFL